MPSLPACQSRLAFPPMCCTDFIDYVVHHHEYPSTVVVCSSREAFLEGIVLSLQAATARDPSSTTEATEQTPHPLLVPTIHQLAASKTISMAFTSSVPHLRAYLASYTPPKNKNPLHDSIVVTKPGSQIPLLAIYGLINLHRATTEYSVQGLSRSLAIAVEAAEAWKLRLLLVENPGDWAPSDPESVSEVATATPGDPWMEQVPFLNSSLVSSDDRLWAGRTVEVRAVVARWCSFSRP